MEQIIAAANATKADIIHLWWTPQPLNEDFYGTDSELIKVVLPTATQECIEAVNDASLRCVDDPGPKEGACATVPQFLTKVIGTSLRQLGENPDIDEALWSPAPFTAMPIRCLRICNAKRRASLPWTGPSIRPSVAP